jgi:heme-degrading monooxygenase HmoA
MTALEVPGKISNAFQTLDRMHLAAEHPWLPSLEGLAGGLMICRMWHGRTPRSKADAYASFLEQKAIPDYRSVPGNLSVAVLRRDEGDATHFLTVTYWRSEDCIRDFAGDDVLKAKYYPEDQDYLLEFEPLVQHYDVTAKADAL